MSQKSVQSTVWKSEESNEYICVVNGALFTTKDIHEATHFQKPEDVGIHPMLVRPVPVRVAEVIEIIECENPECDAVDSEESPINECILETGLTMGLCDKCVAPIKEALGIKDDEQG